MRFSIRAKQIAGVTAIVGLAVAMLSIVYVARLAQVGLRTSETRGQLLANAVIHRAGQLVNQQGDPYEALRTDPGLLAILQSSIYGESVTDAAILDAGRVVIAHSDATRVGRTMEAREDLSALVAASAWNQLMTLYSRDSHTLEFRQPLTLDNAAFGSVRIGVSTLLLRQELDEALKPALYTSAAALMIAVIVAAILAQIVLRPIHVIRSGLTRLGKGEFGVTLDLPPGDEFSELGTFFNAISQQLSADRSQLGGQKTDDPTPAQQEAVRSMLAYSRKLVALGRLTAGLAHEVKNPLNAMMIHLELLRTKLRAGALQPAGNLAEAQSAKAGGRTASLGLALAAGDEAELSPLTRGALDHVEIIEKEVRRLDEVVQGFLKFSRPEDLRLQPVRISSIFDEIPPIVRPEAENHGVSVELTCPDSLPAVHGDAAMLRQAFLNLALNACQAMPRGGSLRLTAGLSGGRVEVRIADTGVGIRPEDLSRIFDLYFTTKEHGTGIGLSMVYRIVQLHDGDIEVESTPGRGTTFRVLLPQAHVS